MIYKFVLEQKVSVVFAFIVLLHFSIKKMDLSAARQIGKWFNRCYIGLVHSSADTVPQIIGCKDSSRSTRGGKNCLFWMIFEQSGLINLGF